MAGHRLEGGESIRAVSGIHQKRLRCGGTARLAAHCCMYADCWRKEMGSSSEVAMEGMSQLEYTLGEAKAEWRSHLDVSPSIAA